LKHGGYPIGLFLAPCAPNGGKTAKCAAVGHIYVGPHRSTPELGNLSSRQVSITMGRGSKFLAAWRPKKGKKADSQGQEATIEPGAPTFSSTPTTVVRQSVLSPTPSMAYFEQRLPPLLQSKTPLLGSIPRKPVPQRSNASASSVVKTNDAAELKTSSETGCGPVSSTVPRFTYPPTDSDLGFAYSVVHTSTKPGEFTLQPKTRSETENTSTSPTSPSTDTKGAWQHRAPCEATIKRDRG
jgi:hypothetical protein